MLWRSKLKFTIALSTMEAEYMVLTNMAKEATWVRTLLGKLKLDENNSTHIYCDSMGVVRLVKNPVLHMRTKHIELQRSQSYIHTNRGAKSEFIDQAYWPKIVQPCLRIYGIHGHHMR